MAGRLSGQAFGMSSDQRSSEREVSSNDPSLTPDANRILTEEAREVVGSDRVSVPADTDRASVRARGTGSPWKAGLASNRSFLIISFAFLLTVGVIVALATGSWWAVLAACAVHALGTVVVVGATIQMSTETEHVSPGAAARLEDEGVPDPDKRLSDLVEEFQGGEAPQRTAVTPSRSSRPVD
jgi:hypothetical protein